MDKTDQHDSEQNLEAPPRLVSALKEISHRDVFIPPHVDRTILKAVQERLSPRAKLRFGNFRHWMLWQALAAACVFVACIAWLLTTRPHYAREDLNHDGKVDILDAFALARQVNSSAPLSTTSDINGDGVVDGRDVALIAAHAVQLKKDNGS